MTDLMVDPIAAGDAEQVRPLTLPVAAAADPASALMVPARSSSDRDRASTRTLRPLRTGSGRRVGPSLRPGETSPAPTLRRGPAALAHGCRVSAPASPRPVPLRFAPQSSARADSNAWRLTDRGIALVLVSGLMIMVAALTVVGLTAARVTDEGYRPSVTQTLPR